MSLFLIKVVTTEERWQQNLQQKIEHRSFPSSTLQLQLLSFFVTEVQFYQLEIKKGKALTNKLFPW